MQTFTPFSELASDLEYAHRRQGIGLGPVLGLREIPRPICWQPGPACATGSPAWSNSTRRATGRRSAWRRGRGPSGWHRRCCPSADRSLVDTPGCGGIEKSSAGRNPGCSFNVAFPFGEGNLLGVLGDRSSAPWYIFFNVALPEPEGESANLNPLGGLVTTECIS